MAKQHHLALCLAADKNPSEIETFLPRGGADVADREHHAIAVCAEGEVLSPTNMSIGVPRFKQPAGSFFCARHNYR